MRKSLGVLLATLLFQPLLPAQETDFETSEEEGHKRKRPSVFIRAAEDSPAAQLAHAASLQAEGKTRRAAKQYRALVHKWHDSAEAPTAQYAYATYLLERGRYEQAFKEFQYLIDNYVGHFPYDEVLEAQFRIANHVRTARRGRLLGLPGFEAPERALSLFEAIVGNGPRWHRTPAAQFYVGMIHEQTGQFEEAVDAYEVVTQRYPNSILAPAAGLNGALCLLEIARVSRRDEKAYWDAVSALSGFIRDYPDAEGVETARRHMDELLEKLAGMYYDRALYYDRTARRPKSAVIAYNDFLKRFPSSDKAGAASARVQRLQQDLEGEKP